jgi:hypothetical protein
MSHMTPPEVLRERLATARRDGVGFDEAWPVALAAAVNTAQWERKEWRDPPLAWSRRGARNARSSHS